MQDFVAMEVGEAAKVEVVVGDEGIDERGAVVKWKVKSGKWKAKVVVEGFREVGRKGGFGRSSDETTFLKVEKGLSRGVVIKGLDAEMAGDGEEEGNRKSGKWKVESGK